MPGWTAARAARDGSGQPAPFRGWCPKLDRPRQIHGVSVVDPPEVQHHPLTRLEAARARAGVRAGAIRPGRHDRLESGTLETDAPDQGIDVGGHLDFRPSLANERRHSRGDLRQPPARFPQRCDFRVILHSTGALDQPLSGDEHRAGPRAGERRRGIRREGLRQPIESPDRHPLALDPDAARAGGQQSLDQRLLQARRRHDDVEVVSMSAARRDCFAGGNCVPEIHNELGVSGLHQEQARRAAERGEIANVRRMRDDQRVDSGVFEGAAQAGESSRLGGGCQGNHTVQPTTAGLKPRGFYVACRRCSMAARNDSSAGSAESPTEGACDLATACAFDEPGPAPAAASTGESPPPDGA
jgi:hypothetical protein